MSSLKSENLLLIAPHFKTFIYDQALPIRSYFNSMTILMPLPYFTNIALKIPYFKRYFQFLKLAAESSIESSQDYTLISTKFFTLPLEKIRKRNCYLTTRSCISALSNNIIDFSLIHAHFLNNGFIGAALKDKYNVPLVVTGHGSDVYDVPFRDDWHRTLARYVLSRADRVITVSQSNADKLRLLGVSENKLHVIPNGYNELFKPIPLCDAREKLGLPLNKKLLLSVGNLIDVKGHTYLIDAMHTVIRKRKDVMLVIVGSGSSEAKLQSKVKKLGLNEKIFIVGRKRHKEIPLWMNAADLLVLPSLSEGNPTVMFEALGSGLPFVGTRVGGVPEIITSEDYGLLCEPKNPIDLAGKILIGLDKEWDRDKILEYAKRFTWENIAKRTLKIYKGVLN